MDEKEVKEFTNKVNENIEKLNVDIEKNKTDVSELIRMQDELRSEIAKLPDEKKSDKMQDQLDVIEKKIKNRWDEDSFVTKSVEEQLYDKLKSDEFGNYKKGDTQGMKFELKASTISTSNSFTETNSKIIPAQRDPVIGIDPRRPFVIQNLVQKRAMGNTDYIDWFERTAETTGTTQRAEAGAYGQSDASWTSYKLPVESTGDYIVTTREKLADTTWIRSEIMAILSYNLPHKLETELWDGTGASNRLWGILGAGAGTYNTAETFAKPTGVNAIGGSVNEYDVLKAAILQVALGNTSNTKATGFIANAIVVNPVDFYNMTSLKDANNQYLMGLDGIMRINGVPVYQTQRISAGTYLVGDFTKAILYIRENASIKMWDQNSNDPIYGRVTFTADQRACFVIHNVNTYAFVTGTFNAGKELLG